MSKQVKSEEELENETAPNGTCFIIMPISEHPDYQEGHFFRVYEHIIKPACKLAGFKPLRADEVKSTNLIALDIIDKIVKCEMAICDLSSKNANVLYEVGIRQAFDKPVTFIKDIGTPRIFDIQGFRDVTYDESLRIDTVDIAIKSLSEAITETYKNLEGVNSLVALLGIEPAKSKKTEISLDTQLILNAIKSSANQGDSRKGVVKFLSVPDGLVRLSMKEIAGLEIGDTLFHRLNGWGKILDNKRASAINIDFGNRRLNISRTSVNLYGKSVSEDDDKQ